MSQLISRSLFRRAFSLRPSQRTEGAGVSEGRILGWHRGPDGDLSPRHKQEGNKRVGLLAVKVGMTRMWEPSSGHAVPCTVLHVRDNHVVRTRSVQEAGYVGLLVGAGDRPWPGPPKERAMLSPKEFKAQTELQAMAKKCRNAGVPFKQHICKFRTTLEGLLPPGTPLDVTHLRVGQFVDLFGFTIDKGFQGVMKRWGFHGMPASHGQTKTHRKMGNVASSGMGRVWKGTKMPGHMGNRPRMSWARRVLRINARLNLVYLKGTVSGLKETAWVQIRDSYKVPPSPCPLLLPYPTSREGEGPGEVFCEEICVPGAESLRFQLDTSRMCRELIRSLEARRTQLANFDIPKDK